MTIRHKVFGIGFHKTGTSSLANALYKLGYNVTGFFGISDKDIGINVFERAYALAMRYDAAQDTPWFLLYKELDGWFPGSKFVLTIRPTEPWIKSVVRHFKGHRIPAHEWIYGVPRARGHEDAYIRRYEAHNQEVLEYFRNRPNDLLVMDITAGDGWEKLCPFLGLKVPSTNFPAQNITTKGWKDNFFRFERYVDKKLFGIETRGSDANSGVSARFIRDIIHYHYAMYQRAWDGINQISEDQFVLQNPTYGISIRDLILGQISEEEKWYRRLSPDYQAKDKGFNPAEFPNKNLTKAKWEDVCFMIRCHVADLPDQYDSPRVPCRNEYIWEVYIHLVINGAIRYATIRRTLQDYSVTIEEISFIDFYN